MSEYLNVRWHLVKQADNHTCQWGYFATQKTFHANLNYLEFWHGTFLIIGGIKNGY